LLWVAGQGMLAPPLPLERSPINHSDVGQAVPRAGNVVTRLIGRTLLSAMRWRLEGELPDRKKFIIAVAPHSSNIDFFLTVGVIMSLGLKCSFLAKDSLFRFPLGIVMRIFGGIPVDRSARNGVVGVMQRRFNNAEQLILGIAPEGTRKKVEVWRSGFAQIAQSANVPVQPAIVHYGRRIVYFTTLIERIDDWEATVRAMQTAALAGEPRRRLFQTN